MKIVIDGRVLGWTGIGRYTKNLLIQLEQLDADNSYVVLMQRADAKVWAPSAPNFQIEWADIVPYSISEQTRLPGVLRRLKPDLVHFPHFTVPLFYNGPFVVTVHDMTLVDYKNYRGSGLQRLPYEIKYVASRLVLRHAVRRARIVISSTNYVKDRLAHHFTLPTDHFTSIPLGFDRLTDTPATSADPARPFIFSLGNSYPYKNLALLVEAFAASAFQAGGGELILGGPEDYFRQQLREFVAKKQLGDGVRFIGRVSDEELARLYQQARLFVFPSLSEGFGLPGLEAMAYGAPVLAADATCLPEVYDQAAAYFDPTSVARLTTALDELVTNDSRRMALVRAGHTRVKRYRWKTTAEQTLATYRVATRQDSLT